MSQSLLDCSSAEEQAETALGVGRSLKRWPRSRARASAAFAPLIANDRFACPVLFWIGYPPDRENRWIHQKIIRPAPLPLSVNGGGGGQTGSFVLPLCRIYRFRVRQAGAFVLSSRKILEFSNIKHTGLLSPESLPVSLEIKE